MVVVAVGVVVVVVGVVDVVVDVVLGAVDVVVGVELPLLVPLGAAIRAVVSVVVGLVVEVVVLVRGSTGAAVGAHRKSRNSSVNRARVWLGLEGEVFLENRLHMTNPGGQVGERMAVAIRLRHFIAEASRKLRLAHGTGHELPKCFRYL